MIGRRELIAGVGFAATMAASSRAVACSTANPDSLEAAKFFRAISRREYAEAGKQLAPGARLTIVTAEKSDIFAGNEIVKRLSNLIHSEGWRLFGDTGQRVNGGFWDHKGGWFCSDLIKGTKLDITPDCDGRGLQSARVFNAYVSLAARGRQTAINQVLLQASSKLNYDGPPMLEIF